ncbi:MAG: hypothetical protein HYV26_18835 [Candidatus Hydrogenedentes bacterium]|nr:hypothetical protein [Candidatus Hydrogenedentota bacterium]
MPAQFKVLTSHLFDRDAKKLCKRHPELREVLKKVSRILAADPYNRAGEFDVKKLTSVKAGEGQWRLRLGVFRLRYDIEGKEVILHSLRPRDQAY